MTETQRMPEAIPPRSPSPAASISSRSGTISKPPPPPKPSHLSCAFTGTVNSESLREYIQAQRTGGSFTESSQAGTLRKADVGFGYGTIDDFVDALDGSDPSQSASDFDTDGGATARPTMRGRTFTAPSVTNLFATPFEDEDGTATTRGSNHEPIQIDGKGPSRVGNLRSMFEPPSKGAEEIPKPSYRATVAARSKTGTISSKVSMLQAQITGERGAWQLPEQPPTSLGHASEASTFSDIMYETAKERMLPAAASIATAKKEQEEGAKAKDAADAPSEGAGTGVPLFDNAITAEPKSAPTPPDSPGNHDRDDSSATIRPGHVPGADFQTQRKISGASTYASRTPSRLSSVFAQSPSSSTPASGRESLAGSGHSPNAKSVASSDDADDDPNRSERSREPSMLVPGDIGTTSAHMRAHDGSAFDFDWINSHDVEPTSTGRSPSPSPSPVPAPGQPSIPAAATSVAPVALRAGPPPQRPESIVLNLETQIEDHTALPDLDSITKLTDSETSHERVSDSEMGSTVDTSMSPQRIVPQPGIGIKARALYDFLGEASFNELSLRAGQTFDILNEELAGGWSLGVVWDESGMPQRGLIPRGWYCYIQDFTMSPPPAQGIEPPPTPSPFPDEAESGSPTSRPHVGLAQNQAPIIQLPPPQLVPPVVESRTSDPLQELTLPVADLASATVEAQEPSLLTGDSEYLAKELQEPTTPRAQRQLMVSHPDANGAVGIQVTPPTAEIQGPAGDTAVGSSFFPWRGSLLGGKTFNRFASFVTSGAEEYVLAKEDDSNDTVASRSMARKVSGGSTMSAASASAGDLTTEEAESSDGIEAASVVHAHDSDHHFVLAGPAGPRWKSKSPPFLVQVHSPEKRTKLNGMQEYTVFSVTSTFPESNTPGQRGSDETWSLVDSASVPYDPTVAPNPPGPTLTVLRRFTQFEWLYQVLTKLYAPLVIPPLPEKQYSGRFATEFIQTRRADLELWISRVIRHPVLRYSEAVLFFLSCDDDIEWKQKAGRLLRGEGRDGSKSRIKGGMFARTWHPDYNFDAAEAALEAEAMDAHLRATERTMNGVGGNNAGKQGVMAAWKGHREGASATCSSYRDLSYNLLRLVTGAGVVQDDQGADQGSEAQGNHVRGPPMGNVGRRSISGATNEHGVWCWREGCYACTNLTYALQNTAETLQDVADMFDDHARETLLRQHERLKDISRPHAAHQSLLETHRATLAKYRQATGEPDPLATDSEADGSGISESTVPQMSEREAEKVAARCETVLNVTLAEIDRAHDERVQDYYAMGRSFLDDEIELYEGVLETLRAARAHYDPRYYDCEPGVHLLPSRFQGDLSRPKKQARPLAMPSAPGGGGGLGVGRIIGTGALTRPASTGDPDARSRSPSAAGSFFLSHAMQGTTRPLGESTSVNAHNGDFNTATTPKVSQLTATTPAQQSNRTSYFSLWR